MSEKESQGREKEILKAQDNQEEKPWLPFSLETLMEDSTRNKQRHIPGLGTVRFKTLTHEEIAGIRRCTPWTEKELRVLRQGLRALNPGITGGEILGLSTETRAQLLEAIEADSGILGDDPIARMAEWIAEDERAQLMGLACHEFQYSLDDASKLTHGQLVFLAAWLKWYNK